MPVRPISCVPPAALLLTALLAAGWAGLYPATAQPAGDCGRAIAEFQAIIDDDKRTGHVNASVHRRIVADLASVNAACAGGRGDAVARLRAVKKRYGYP